MRRGRRKLTPDEGAGQNEEFADETVGARKSQEDRAKIIRNMA